MRKCRVRIVVSGRVQGVFFRASTRSAARRLDLAGWVRNREDGSVEITAEGERDNLNELVRWCRKGPEDARVDEVEVEWEEDLSEFEAFTIEF